MNKKNSNSRRSKARNSKSNSRKSKNNSKKTYAPYFVSLDKVKFEKDAIEQLHDFEAFRFFTLLLSSFYYGHYYLFVLKSWCDILRFYRRL